MPEAQLFFVYGTLRRGDDNDITRLEPAPVFVGHAQIKGTMFHLGGYPGVLLEHVPDLANSADETSPAKAPSHPDDDWVVGEVYEVKPELEAKLDAIESEYPAQSDEYFKRVIKVWVNEAWRSCCVYEINPKYVQDKPVIASGDWCKDR